MRKTAISAAAILALSLMLSACSGAATDTSSSESAAPESSETETEMMHEEVTGTFEGAGEHSVEGTVTVSDIEIVLSGYSSDEGPDLNIYLTNGNDEDAVAAGMQIDSVVFDEASQTFTFDAMDISGYDTVVIYCDKVKAIFGSASLS
ncbi:MULTISPECIES: DM13 domain-containing protein [unclassified Salinibacterium]|uniref:DM13 domain-containing protein n=1 Tax=unclassified Salinibacterium TaxID=2632331 RepID=UPI0018CDF012|nr:MULTISPECIES: DM13 domain-containing protein [unclassified Salinibacterium]MBH0054732.1 DM13 domain-containing protein [Salinibacterium sp. SWN139]MBH0084117.1 DM13 domain-containing protein [Salinibacterium sp. SWN167]MBH0117508.1 DM13 domain-containing protein [Salinibacterium sp. NG253]